MDRRDSGFTLTEALIATAILSVLTLSVLLTIRTIVDADRGLRGTVAHVEERLLLNEVVRDVARFSYRPPNADASRRFTGGPSGFSSLVHPPGEQAPQFAVLSFEGGTVSLSLSPLDSRAPAQVALLYEGAEEVRARYWGRLEGEASLRWYPSWDDASPPILVSIEIQEENGQVWRIDALIEGQGGFDCSLNRETGTCMEL